MKTHSTYDIITEKFLALRNNQQYFGWNCDEIYSGEQYIEKYCTSRINCGTGKQDQISSINKFIINNRYLNSCIVNPTPKDIANVVYSTKNFLHLLKENRSASIFERYDAYFIDQASLHPPFTYKMLCNHIIDVQGPLKNKHIYVFLIG